MLILEVFDILKRQHQAERSKSDKAREFLFQILLLGAALSLYLVQHDALQITGGAICCAASGSACGLGRQKIRGGMTYDGGNRDGYSHFRRNLFNINVNILRNIPCNAAFQIDVH